MIANHLRAYCTAFGTYPGNYTILRSFVADDNQHETAWIQFTGSLEWDITGQKHEGHPMAYFGLVCECKFTYGVGWSHFPSPPPPQDARTSYIACPHRRAVISLRQQELQAEYRARFCKGPRQYLGRYAREITLDLIERVKANEFIGNDDDGLPYVKFVGEPDSFEPPAEAYFHLQTLAAILGKSPAAMIAITSRLQANGIIGINGSIITAPDGT